MKQKGKWKWWLLCILLVCMVLLLLPLVSHGSGADEADYNHRLQILTYNTHRMGEFQKHRATGSFSTSCVRMLMSSACRKSRSIRTTNTSHLANSKVSCARNTPIPTSISRSIIAAVSSATSSSPNTRLSTSRPSAIPPCQYILPLRHRRWY